MHPATLTAFVAYLVMLFVISGLAWLRTRDVSDYVLGGRHLGPAVAALSAGASDMSGWLLLGLPGAVFLAGLSAGWIVVGLVTGAWLNWLFVAARLRNATASAGDALTLPEFFGNHLAHTASPTVVRALRLTTTVMVLFFFTFYVASGLVAGARLFESTLDMSYTSALTLGAVVIVAYTVAGGFLAVSWTDFFQGILMLLALLAIPLLLLASDVDLAARLQALDPPRLDALGDVTPLALVSLLAWGLGYFGQPHILARFMAIESADDVPRARHIGMTWMIIAAFAAVAVGLGGSAWFEGTLEEPETVFIELTAALLHPWIAGIVLAAILAAVMSTIDSQLLVASTSLAEDVYKPFVRPQADAVELLRVGRGAVILVAIVALTLAANPDSKVLGLVSYAWAGLGASFGPVVLLCLYWRGLNAAGALAGVLAGGVTVIVWGSLSGGVFDVYEILPGFVMGLLAACSVSLLLPGQQAAPTPSSAQARAVTD